MNPLEVTFSAHETNGEKFVFISKEKGEVITSEDGAQHRLT
jgi:hypothetical protein